MGRLDLLVWPTCCIPVLQVIICLIICLTICFIIKTLLLVLRYIAYLNLMSCDL